jgi:SdrD B-like domain/Secretion system C-terminal sorting domain
MSETSTKSVHMILPIKEELLRKAKALRKTTSVRLVSIIMSFLLCATTVVAQGPTTPAQGFMVFAESNATFATGNVQGAVAAGANVTLNGSFPIAGNVPGAYTVETGKRVGLWIGGTLSGTGSSVVGQATYIKVANMTGLSCAVSGAQLFLNRTSNGSQIASGNASQPCNTVSAMGSLNVASAFTTMRSTASCFAGKTQTATVNRNDPNNPTITLGGANGIYYATLTTADLSGNGNWIVNGADANHLLVININFGGSSYNWNSSFKFQSNVNNFALFNIINCPTLTMTSLGSSLNATLFAPNSDVVKIFSANIEGQVIAKNYTHHAGEVHTSTFANTFDCATSNVGCGTCTGNLVLNPGFENGTTNWSWGGGNLSTGNGAVACGSFSGDLENTTTNSWANQTIGTDLAVGTTVNASVWAGTHDNTKNNWVAIEFYNASGAWMSQSVYIQVDKILANSPTGPQLYNFSAVVPAGAKFTRVAFGGDGSWTKTDQWCVTTTAPVTGCIGDFVWNDANGNGIQDAGETGLSGVTVNLKNSAGTTISTTTSNSTGFYQFTGLAAGSYTVEFVGVSGFGISPANQGGDDTKDNDATDAGNGNATVAVTLTAGQCNNTVDAGFCPTTLCVGNRVFWDLNDDGFRQDNEGGINGLTVNLYKDNNNDNVADGAAIATTTTNATGFYEFCNLAPGNYIVGVVTPAGFVRSAVNGGDPDNNIDRDNNGTSVVGNETRGLAITLTGGSEFDGSVNTSNTNITYDFGFRGVLSLGNQVFYDPNNNGLYEPANGEFGIDGRTVNLYADANNDNTPDGAAIATTTTTGGGLYQFTVAPGNYIVSVVLPGGEFISTPSNDPDDNVDNDNDGVFTPGDNTSGKEYFGRAITMATGTEPTGGNTNNTYDFGQYKGQSLGDFVWIDANNNGVQDGGEAGLANVTVTLRNGTGGVIATTTTDANGFYLFYNIPAGSYQLQFTTPSGYIASPANQGGDDNRDSDPVSGIITGITLAPGEFNRSYDAGFVPNNLNVGNLVWYDINNNGTRDAGEPGIDGAVVRLYLDANNDNIADGAAIATQNTSGGGLYNFTGLAANNYIVGVTIPSGYAVVTTNGGDPDNNTDNDNNGTNTSVAGEVRSGAVTLSLGAEPGTAVDGDGNNGNLTVDFAFRGTGSIGDFVWNDLNNNGIQEANEPGLGGALVTLTFANGTTLTATTNATGGYLFSNLAPGTYTVTFTTPSGATPAPSNLGGDDTKDSDPVNGVVSGIVLTAGQNNQTVDAGFVYPTGSIGDRVWHDVNRNGIQDAGEVGLAGITVTLYDGAGAIVATTATDGFGNYLFSNLPVASGGTNYQVRFSLPAEYTFSPQNAAGSTAANNSDANPATGFTSTVTLTPANKDRSDVDAGMFYTIPARIGDFIWNDLNKNGVQDPGEPGIAGVTVTLFNSAGVPIRTTITDNNGYYQFTDVPLGTYTVGITPPVGYVLSNNDQGGNDDTDSDFDAGTFRTAPFNVTTGTTNLSFDGGLNVTPSTRAAIGDRVWYDLNNNGLQDAGEPGVPGVTVQLFNSANTLIATQITDAFGNYMFNNVVPGPISNSINYYVTFSNLPSGYVFTAPNVGGEPNNQIDSDVTGANGTGSTPLFRVVDDETRITVDAGIRNPNVASLSTLGDLVWYDLNKNGIQDAGEAGVPGVAVTLFNATTGAVIKTTTTDGNGFYLFTDLSNGSYAVGFSTLPGGYVFTGRDLGANDNTDSDVDPSTGRTGTYTISAPGSNLSVDAGIFPTPNVNNAQASIGDRVWNDLNSNGIQDAGEPGIPGVTVTLFAGDGTTVIATTTTDGAGNYIFTNLPAGNYVVGFSNLPAGYVFTTQNAGTDPTKDSNPNTGTGKTAPITLAAGEINLTIDAGIRATTPKAALGDRVWLDANANGIQDAGEMGVGGVSVTLFNASGVAVQTTVTNASGNYLFTDLDAGTYTIGFTNLPTGYTPTTLNAAGSTAANNSDANVTTGRTASITLAAGTTDLTWDMGIISTSRAALGDYVWFDTNNNGIQDATERGAAGVTATLFNSSNVAIASTVTDANGFYMFNNLNPGQYTVGFTNLPVNTTFTTKNATGSTAANNSDVNIASGRTDVITLAAGTVRTDVDAGLISNFAAVGDFVWYDIDANGRQDAGEPGVPGVTVTLFDLNGNRVASAVTDGRGRYFINNIPVPATGASFTIGFTDLPINVVGYTIKNVPGAPATLNSNPNPATGVTDPFTLLPGQIDLTIDAGVITSTGGPLPVTITALSGVYTNGISKLNWATVSEQNFSHFEVEYSTTGNNFTFLGKVSGAGNSNSRIEYGFNHLQPVTGLNYYRLKMVDLDGRYTYSNVVALNVSIKGLTISSVFPNPFIDKVNIAVAAASKEKVSIRLFDNAGKLVYNNETVTQLGNNNFTISNLGKLAAGTYIIQVSAGETVLTKQLTK